MTVGNRWYLLVNHKNEGRTDIREFTDQTMAVAALNEAEERFTDRRHHGPSNVDVLLVGAPSIDAVKKHYPSYFINGRSRAEKVRQLLNALPVISAG
ncbi:MULTISPECIES: hypothetical protein [Thermocrispum]|uniref:Uncharacterized protein n=1 Tax=Thermocrispum agreste TaxID=37925 RepID=A0A2W4LV31_9PSEU|nr:MULTISPECIES: hypothetical protein [Thermocrispum]PZN01514.1 MAG: hypothetical protein DIU77_00435 [Thermocrispum agreste]